MLPFWNQWNEDILHCLRNCPSVEILFYQLYQLQWRFHLAWRWVWRLQYTFVSQISYQYIKKGWHNLFSCYLYKNDSIFSLKLPSLGVHMCSVLVGTFWGVARGRSLMCFTHGDVGRTHLGMWNWLHRKFSSACVVYFTMISFPANLGEKTLTFLFKCGLWHSERALVWNQNISLVYFFTAKSFSWFRKNLFRKLY